MIKIVSWKPRILVVDNFLSPKECEYFIKLGNGDDLKRSLVMSETEKDSVVSEGRTSHTSFLNNSENIGDIKILEIEKRIAELTMIPVENGERFQVLRYKIGQEYKPHFDYFKKSGLKRAKIKKQGGQRIATVLVYLGEPQSGGETIFPKVNIKIKSKRGRAVFFYNIQTDGSEDELSLHGSMPVEEGEKWTLTKWLRASKNNQR
jgi:prolyl 4-hydroxylase